MVRNPQGAWGAVNSDRPGTPFIITAELPADLAKWATALRTAHYPPERNYLKAHVTLFRGLPPSCEGEIKSALATLASQNSPVLGSIEGAMEQGQGTALRISSPAMLDLWDELADRFHGLLTPQDQSRPRLHVTIQNKVTPAAAKALQAELMPQIDAREFRFTGLSLNIYRGGPWEFVRTYPFRG